VFVLNAGLRVVDWVEAADVRAEYRALTSADGAADGAPEGRAADVIARWRDIESRARPGLAGLRTTIERTASGSPATLYRERARTSLILQAVVALNAWFLDALAVMLLGMAAWRSGLLAEGWPTGRIVALMAAGYGIGLPLSAAETASLLASEFDPLVRRQWLVVYDLRRVAVAAGHLALLLLVHRRGRLAWLRARLAEAGRMALSNYLGQSIAGGLLFYSVGLGLFGRVTGAWLYLVVAGIWMLQLATSHWWLARFRLGPAEWLWRSLTYRRRQPLRRPAAEPVTTPGTPG